MNIETRNATASDAAFLAWVMQAAARSHLEKGIWDVCFPGDDGPRLENLAAIATTERVHFSHFERFRVLEVDGQPACALATYERSQHGVEHLNIGIAQALTGRGWSPQQLLALGERTASFDAIGYPNDAGLWIIEWVATRPEFRGRALVRQLLREALELGRKQGFARAQIGYLMGNLRAKSAYEGVGFRGVAEHRHPDFERQYGVPGVARMQLDLNQSTAPA